MALETPVVLIIFNRPRLTRRVFDAIAQARPRRLFLIADGPRGPHDESLCQQARAVVGQVDWDCTVETNFAERNLGCGVRPATGISWAFSRVEEAIILEDDCLPAPSFFTFCAALLEYYRHDERVMEIGGNNFLFGRRVTPDSYYFSKYSHTWGWATWRRAWQSFDLEMRAWSEVQRSGRWTSICGNRSERRYWERIFEQIVCGTLTSTWDYQWQFARWCQNGLVAVPEVNLVSNIGFGPGAKHTLEKNDVAEIPTGELTTLRHPSLIVAHQSADRELFKTMFRTSAVQGAWRRLGRLVSAMYWRAWAADYTPQR